MAEIPHFAVPFKIGVLGHGAPTAMVTEQDTAEEILDCVEVVLRYETGFRQEKPEFGIADQTFVEGVPDTRRITQSVNVWEPRAETIITANVDELDALISIVRVAV